ncbi:hypothetical protein L596_017449 [Steinernema carpocapsae]|uniref:Uncharacterized protein n=1 Tax=Steinernema carpocapsae TaxID=34508 RepID=A0A4U5N204_STECR|nr:hypothetical protein L596_017449 [Steinernema carpocapsae]
MIKQALLFGIFLVLLVTTIQAEKSDESNEEPIIDCARACPPVPAKNKPCPPGTKRRFSNCSCSWICYVPQTKPPKAPTTKHPKDC